MTLDNTIHTGQNAGRIGEQGPTTDQPAFCSEHLQLGYIVWDELLRVVEWDGTAEKIFGWSAGEARGKRAGELITTPDGQASADLVRAKLLEGSASACLTQDNVDRQGRRLVCEWYNTALKDPSGGVYGVLSLVRDVTENASREREHSESRKFLQTIIETEPECVKLLNADGTLLLMNRAGLDMIEADSLDQVKDHSVYPLVVPEYRQAFKKLTEDVFQGRAGNLTFEMAGLKGRRLWLNTHAVPLRNDRDEIIALVAITRDVTEWKAAKDSLLEQMRFAENVVANSAVPTFVVNPRHHVVLWNKACEELTGISAAELVGTDQQWRAFYAEKRPTLADIIINGDIDQAAGMYAAVSRPALIQNGLRAEGYRNLNGHDRYIIFDAAPVYNSSGELSVVIETVHDVTDQKQAEEVLKKERDFTAAVLDTVGAMVLVLDGTGKIVRFNRTCEEVSGYRFEEVAGKYVWDFLVPPEQVESVKKVFQNLSAGQFPNKFENYWIAKDGRRKLIAWSNTALLDGGGAVEYVIPTGIDITEQRRAESELLKEKSFSDSIIDSLPGTFYICDEEGRLIRWNNNEKEITGYSRDELSGMNVLKLFREDRDLVASKMKEVYESGRASVEARIVTKSGMSIPFLLTGFRMDRDGRQYLVGVGMDVSERIHLEEQLRQSQKMECLGTLAGGIAHDFNNILTAIIGYGNLLQMKMGETDPLRHNVEQILASANRAASLTQGLLAYSRKQILNPQPVNLNEIIRKVERLLVRLIGEDVELKVVLTDADTTIEADAGQIEQVLMNLATNARDAMPDGGPLFIETEVVEIDAASAQTHDFQQPGQYVLITVTDSGTGMDDRTRERVFEPFFTTKEAGRGTGLGLAMVYGIVTQHNGSIHIDSQVGQGTSFRIYLPVASSAPDALHPVELPPIEGGAETILVAEDDESVRNLTCNMLEQFGYTVIQAEDGEDAVRKFMANRDAVQLLILDVIMPRKNGREAYEKIRIFRPDIKALFFSGYTADIIHQKGLLDSGVHFILKPVPMNELLRKVRTLLDNPA